MKIWKFGNLEIWKVSLKNLEIWKWKSGNLEIWKVSPKKSGNLEIREIGLAKNMKFGRPVGNY